MKLGLSLSGERVPELEFPRFDEVGLIRSEYLFRRAGVYPRRGASISVVAGYLDAVAASSPGRIWYRTLEVDAAEANVLGGVEETRVEPDRLRGIRRSMAHPEAYVAELEAVARSSAADVGIVVPFVSTLAEAAWAAETVRSILPRARLGCMVEVPSIMMQIPRLPELGFDRIVVGCNDLGSLCLATARKVTGPSGVPAEFKDILAFIGDAAAASGMECVAAGYLTKEMLEFFAAAGYSGVTVHYCDLPGVFDIDPQLLPDIGLLSRIKDKTRAAIVEFNRAHGVHQDIY